MSPEATTTFITPLYAGFFGILFTYLSWRVVSLRGKLQVRMGDGGHSDLTGAVRAHGNLLEYLPTALILMLMLEFLGYSNWIIHSLGVLLIFARLLHLTGMHDPSGNSPNRRLGTRLTWLQMTIASVLCILGYFGITY